MVASLYTPAEEKKEIWVFLEQEGGKLLPVTLELLGKGRELGLITEEQHAELVERVRRIEAGIGNLSAIRVFPVEETPR